MIKLKNIVIALAVIVTITSCKEKHRKVLVFSKTKEFRHKSIEVGIDALKKMGIENGFEVTATEDSSLIVEDTLRNYSAVIFLNTTGDVLDDVQQADFERYIQSGGGFVGVHAATDTEYDWPWYSKLVGANFKSHPKIQTAQLQVMDSTHLATEHLSTLWEKEDEWYNFKEINESVNVLLKIDEDSYEGGENGESHPISWNHQFDGGKSFYTGMGHTMETYSDKNFLKHLLGGINYAIGENKLDYTLAKSDRVPPENRFIKKVLDFNLDEPMELVELPGIGILFIERKGNVKLYDFENKKTKDAGKIDIFYGNEDGLIGLAADPNFEKNNWIYLCYSPSGNKPIQRVSRFAFKDNGVDIGSEKILLEIPVMRICCHSGGGLEFGPNGNLFIGLGDNTNPFESDGFSPIDERDNREGWDAQKSAGNTNDLRGKILRIKPEDNGTYTIPKGNLFPEGTLNTRPEIYVMGTRNPFRFSIDSKTGYLYWGDVGPDAGKPKEDRGPHGMGEFDQARAAGFWGWPYTRGNNQLYNDFDFKTEISGPKFDSNNLINDSPNNTGMQKLPPAKESLIWYSYRKSQEFPWLGSGGVNPMGGPVFHASDSRKPSERMFPDYFEDKLIVYEWMRDWIYVVTLDNNQNYVKAEAFMPNTKFSHPMDIIFAEDGTMYLLEYGQKWNTKNLDARLSQISYISGNRNPIARIETDKKIGAVPLTINFSGDTSSDYDGDKLTYEWYFTSLDKVQSSKTNQSFTFNEVGSYNVRLNVTDEYGNTSQAETKILVGNSAPEIKIEINPTDTSNKDEKTLEYKVSVVDSEDGNSKDGSIDKDRVRVTFNYISQGEDMIMATLGHQQSVIHEGKKIMDNTDCRACHGINEKVNGPSYIEIAERYSIKDKNYLIDRISRGGSGVWGESLMSAHPQLSLDEIGKMVDYIYTLKPDSQPKPELLPLSGIVKFNEHLNDENPGKYILMASYLDDGNEKVPNSSLSANKKIVFTTKKEKNQ